MPVVYHVDEYRIASVCLVDKRDYTGNESNPKMRDQDGKERKKGEKNEDPRDLI